jgi:YVTN family beta-propeller protein
MPKLRSLLTLIACVGVLLPTAASEAFVTFERGQVRPLAVSPDGTHLFATNTPDSRLEIFDLTSGTPVHTGSAAVGLEPVAARTDGEVWVVNHLSDSVSIVDVTSSPRTAPIPSSASW